MKEMPHLLDHFLFRNKKIAIFTLLLLVLILLLTIVDFIGERQEIRKQAFFEEIPAKENLWSLLPYFKAHKKDDGSLINISGRPTAITLDNNKAVVEFSDQSSGLVMFVDPLAFVSQEYGEHPADKLLRLKAQWDLTIDQELLGKLQNLGVRDSLFHTLDFEYLAGKTTSGLLSEVTIDGSFVVIVNPLPDEWDANPPKTDLNPILLAVYPEHIVSLPAEFVSHGQETQSISRISREKIVDLEKPVEEVTNEEIIAISQARAQFLNDYQKVSDFVQSSSQYQDLLQDLGYQFSPDIFGSTLQEKVKGLLESPTGTGLSSRYWKTAKLKEMGLALDQSDRLVGILQEVGSDIYFSTYGSYPDSTFGRVYKLTRDGILTKVVDTPGRILLNNPNPLKPGKILISADGYYKDDPRFQSLFEFDINTQNYMVIHFPGQSRGGFDELYASDGSYLNNGSVLLLDRYGFPDEGGGIWVLDLNTYEPRQLVSWDHVLTWRIFESQLTILPMLITGKEVDDDFSMTVSKAQFISNGTNSEVNNVSRLGKMTGWNPLIRFTDNKDGKIVAYIETPYNYPEYLVDFPSAIYRIEIANPKPTAAPTPTATPTPTPCLDPRTPLNYLPVNGGKETVGEAVDLQVLPVSASCGSNQVEYLFRHQLANDFNLGNVCNWSTSYSCQVIYNQIGTRKWQVRARIYDDYYQVFRESSFSNLSTIDIVSLDRCQEPTACDYNFGCRKVSGCVNGNCIYDDSYDTEGLVCAVNGKVGYCINKICVIGSPPR